MNPIATIDLIMPTFDTIVDGLNDLRGAYEDKDNEDAVKTALKNFPKTPEAKKAFEKYGALLEWSRKNA